MKLKVHVKSIDGTQMAAKIVGEFTIDQNTFDFTAIAFGRIGGQNIGAKLSEKIENELKEYGVSLETHTKDSKETGKIQPSSGTPLKIPPSYSYQNQFRKNRGYQCWTRE